MATCSLHDVKTVRAICIGACQYRGKCLYYSCFLDSLSMRLTRDHVRRESRVVVNGAMHGL